MMKEITKKIVYREHTGYSLAFQFQILVYILGCLYRNFVGQVVSEK